MSVITQYSREGTEYLIITQPVMASDDISELEEGFLTKIFVSCLDQHLFYIIPDPFVISVPRLVSHLILIQSVIYNDY